MRWPVPEFYTIKQVAASLKICRMEVSRLIKRGQMSGGEDGLWPVIKIGRAVRISEEAVKKFVKRRELVSL
jgi:excisionase family DNA binding protein